MLAVLQLQQPQVALAFAAAHSGILVASVLNGNVAEKHFPA
jgi:hypothetical protein